MKCDKYKVLIDRLIDGDVASNEKAELIDHIEQCELCRQEYQAVLSYLAATSGLSKVKPVFANKKEFIDHVFENLSDINEGTKPVKRVMLLGDSRFRRTIASLAAALVLFFMVQQTHDAWQVKQLEEKVATKQIFNGNNFTSEQSFVELLTKIESDKETASQLSEYKRLFLQNSLLRIGKKYGY
jgi:hypothetical protein